MKVKKSTGERIFQVFNYIFLTIITLVCLYPMWHVAVASFSNSNRLMSHTGFLLKPLGFSVQAYIKVFENPMILKGYLNNWCYFGLDPHQPCGILLLPQERAV